MKIYSKKNVVEAGLERVERVFQEFEEVIVGFSGGKDSTVTLHLALDVAKKLNRLPLKVMWVDQEAEWQSTCDYVQSVFDREDVEPIWFQMPMKWNNNMSNKSKHITIWEEGKEWIREKSPISIKENRYLNVGFNELFGKILEVDFADKKTCYLSGVRTEESPKRFVALTTSVTYQDITWAKKLKDNLHYTFYPIYDWSYTDVWKYINAGKLNYNTIYDELYRKGVGLNQMRVSSLHHETSLKALLLVQELEPKTWVKMARRHEGINTIKHLKGDAYKCPKNFPYMFESWKEYALHLADKLIDNEKNKKSFYKQVENYKFFDNEFSGKDYWRVMINTILSLDFDYTKLSNFTMSANADTFRRYHRNPKGAGKDKFVWKVVMLKNTRYLTTEQKIEITEHFRNERLKK